MTITGMVRGSATGPLRRALLDERGEPLAEVLAGHGLGHALHRHPPAHLVGGGGRLEQDLAGLTHGHGGVGAHLLGERGGDLERLTRLAQPVHEAMVVGQLGRDGIAREGQFHRHVEGNLARQAEQAAGRGHERPLDLGDAERGGRRGDDEVAGQHDLGAAGEGGTVDRGDDRLGALPLGDAAEAAPFGLQRAGVAGVDLLEIGARAEHGGLTGEDAHPDAVVGLDLVDGVLDALGDGAVDGVAGFGTVDLDDRERSPLLEFDSHGATLVIALFVQGNLGTHHPQWVTSRARSRETLAMVTESNPLWTRGARGTSPDSTRGRRQTTWMKPPATCSARSAGRTRSTVSSSARSESTRARARAAARAGRRTPPPAPTSAGASDAGASAVVASTAGSSLTGASALGAPSTGASVAVASVVAVSVAGASAVGA